MSNTVLVFIKENVRTGLPVLKIKSVMAFFWTYTLYFFTSKVIYDMI